MAQFVSSFQNNFYNLFSVIAILLPWEAELSQSCALLGILP